MGNRFKENRRITYNCEVCGKETEVILSQYNKSEHHFCSKECKSVFQSNTYGLPKGYARCNKCGDIKPIEEFMVQKRRNGTTSYLVCKVCEFFRKKKDFKVAKNWNMEEYRIILDNILNDKIEYLDELTDKIKNKTLEEICLLLKNHLKINGHRIQVKQYCTYCGEEFGIKLFQYFDNSNTHFCSPKCNTKYYGEIKRSNTPVHKKICQYCGREFIVSTSRVNSGNDKYCSPECSQKSQVNKILVKCDLCGKEIEVTPYRFQNQNHNFCSVECSRNFFVGENANTWHGGQSELKLYLRNQLTSWKEKSKEYYNYHCVISGSIKYHIHHPFTFNKIFDEIFNEIKLPIYQTIGEYTPEELLIIKNKCIELHFKYGYGILLREDIHYLYHNIYGDDNTLEQFKEFKQRYLNGEFVNLLSA